MTIEQIEVDARNLSCPMPLLKLKQALNQAKCGQLIVLKATDPASTRDVVAFAKLAQHDLQLEENGKEFHFLVTKG